VGYSNRNLSFKDREFSSIERSYRGARYGSEHRANFSLKTFLSFATLLGFGLLYRLDFLFPNHFVVDADEAIVGLMAKHITEGQAVPIFYYGQHYMGSLEPYLTSLVFRVFGVSSLTLKIVPLVFSLGLILLMFQLGKEIANRRVGWIAAIFTALPPVALTIWSAKARGGFIEILFIGAYALLLAVRWLKDRDFNYSGLCGLAMVLGFGWWTNNQVVFFGAPCAFVVLSKLLYYPFRSQIIRLAAAVQTLLYGLCFFILGGLPFWIYNLQNNFISFQMFRQAGGSDSLKHLQGTIDISIPILFGAKHLWESADIYPHASLIAYGGLIFGMFSFCLIYYREIFALLLLRIDPTRPVGIIPVFLLASFAAFICSSFGHLVQAPRYLLPTYVGFFLMFALVIDRIGIVIRGATIVLTLLLVSMHLASAYVGGRALPGEPIVYNWDRVAKDHKPLIEFLNSHNYRWIRTNYWIGYRLAFETKEQIRFLVFQEPHQTRIESYKIEGRAEGEDLMPLVLSTTQAPLVETALRALGYEFSRAEVSDYIIFHELRYTQKNLTTVPPSSFALHASQKDDVAELAADENTGTRWGSGEPQKPGMEFRIEFKEPQNIRGLQLDMSNWETDFPRGLKIEAELGNGERRMLLDSKDYLAALYYLNHNPVFSLMFSEVNAKQVIFTETESDPVFDWSIAELRVQN